MCVSRLVLRIVSTNRLYLLSVRGRECVYRGFFFFFGRRIATTCSECGGEREFVDQESYSLFVRRLLLACSECGGVSVSIESLSSFWCVVSPLPTHSQAATSLFSHSHLFL